MKPDFEKMAAELVMDIPRAIRNGKDVIVIAREAARQIYASGYRDGQERMLNRAAEYKMFLCGFEIEEPPT